MQYRTVLFHHFTLILFVRETAADARPTSDKQYEASVPLRLQLTGSPSGGPDLRLQLFQLNTGSTCEHRHRQKPVLQQAGFSRLSGLNSDSDQSQLAS